MNILSRYFLRLIVILPELLGFHRLVLVMPDYHRIHLMAFCHSHKRLLVKVPDSSHTSFFLQQMRCLLQKLLLQLQNYCCYNYKILRVHISGSRTRFLFIYVKQVQLAINLIYVQLENA
jgi:hypothetical protein